MCGAHGVRNGRGVLTIRAARPGHLCVGFSVVFLVLSFSSSGSGFRHPSSEFFVTSHTTFSSVELFYFASLESCCRHPSIICTYVCTTIKTHMCLSSAFVVTFCCCYCWDLTALTALVEAAVGLLGLFSWPFFERVHGDVDK